MGEQVLPSRLVMGLITDCHASVFQALALLNAALQQANGLQQTRKESYTTWLKGIAALPTQARG